MRDKQLIIELAIIAIVFLLIVSGGASISRGTPPQWNLGLDPSSASTATASRVDLAPIALYYNLTLAELGMGEYANVSFLLASSAFVNVPPDLVSQSGAANNEIALMNVSIPQALEYFELSREEISAKQYSNASVLVDAGCLQAQDAQANYTRFANTTTPHFSELGIPIEKYSVGMDLVRSSIAALSSECGQQRSEIEALYPSGEENNNTAWTLAISSPQKSIETGGRVVITGVLAPSKGGMGLSGQIISLYFNGTYTGSGKTSAGGYLNLTLSIPFVYASGGDIWGSAQSNSTIDGFPGAISNHLHFSVLFNSTRIVVGDPPSYLPTFNFTVQGNLTTSSGVPLPDAPVRVTFMNETIQTTTNTKGVFSGALTVPPYAQDGTYYVYAEFAPRGSYGPSFNFTTVKVTHEPMRVNVNLPPVILAGFTGTISGSAQANGTTLSNVSIILRSAWGTQYTTHTNSEGDYMINVGVPLLEFAFSQEVSIVAVPHEPYISGASVTQELGVFNILWIAIPSAVIGTVAYELNLLGLLPSINSIARWRRGEQKEGLGGATLVGGPSLGQGEGEEESHGDLIATPPAQASGISAAFSEALALAKRRFHGADFRDSMTIREIINSVSGLLAGTDELGARDFSELCLVMEDYLFSKTFNEKKNETRVAVMLSDLRRMWGS